MFTPANTDGFRQVLPGVALKTLAHAEQTLFAEFRLSQGHVLPRHSPPHEQTGYLVRGAIELTIGSESFTAGPGDCWCIPGGVEHHVLVLEDSVAIEVFAPVREDYLARPPETTGTSSP